MNALEGVGLFLDTTVLITAAENRDRHAWWILYQSSARLYSNEYCMKELRYYLGRRRQLNQQETNEVIESIRKKVIVLSTPQQSEYLKLDLPDKLKSDKPIVKSALDANLILVTHDRLLHKEAKKYVKTSTPQELVV